MKFKLYLCSDEYHLLLSSQKIKYLTKQEARDTILSFNAIAKEEPIESDYPDGYNNYDGQLIAELNDVGSLIVYDSDKLKAIMTLDPDEFPYLTSSEFANKYDRDEANMRKYCRKGRIMGAVQVGKYWLIPKNADYPKDQRAGRKVPSRRKKKSVDEQQ